MSEQTELREVLRAPERPSVLFRAFTVHPDNLSLEMFGRPLAPGSEAADDPNRIGDGNERGVYMSTNSYMVEKVYATGGKVPDSYIKTPNYKSHGGITNGITLPVCGVVLEIDPANLGIREPKMIPALMGHYNNGFEGFEWIADSVPSKNYKLLKLVLSTHPNDTEKLTQDVKCKTDKEVLEAIEKIQSEFKRKKEQALEYKRFLEELSDRERMNEFSLKKKWEIWQKLQ